MPFVIFDQIVATAVRLKNFAFTVALALSVLALLVVGYRYIAAPSEGRQAHGLVMTVIIGVIIVLLASQLPGLLRELLGR